MKKNRRLFLQIIICLGLVLTTCACRRDNMEDISIITTNYPNEYIISSLYGKHATISSVYPDGVNTKTYKITNKRKEDLIKTKEFIDTLNNVERVDVLPYHTLGVHKYKDLGLKYPLEGVRDGTQEDVDRAKNILGI